MDEGLELLASMFKDSDWFSEVGTDNLGRYVVYVKYKNKDNMALVPDKVMGKQVLVHFLVSKVAKREDFTNNGNHIPFANLVKRADLPTLELVLDDGFEELSSDLLEIDLGDLTRELDRLEKSCGSNTLQDLFYEIHDKKNAVTNLSSRYPEVRASLESLYNEYGFDVIYEELDG